MNISNLSYLSFIGPFEVLTTIHQNETYRSFSLKSEVLLKSPESKNSYKLMDIILTELEDSLSYFGGTFTWHMEKIANIWGDKVTPTEEGVD